MDCSFQGTGNFCFPEITKIALKVKGQGQDQSLGQGQGEGQVFHLTYSTYGLVECRRNLINMVHCDIYSYQVTLHS